MQVFKLLSRFVFILRPPLSFIWELFEDYPWHRGLEATLAAEFLEARWIIDICWTPRSLMGLCGGHLSIAKYFSKIMSLHPVIQRSSLNSPMRPLLTLHTRVSKRMRLWHTTANDSKRYLSDGCARRCPGRDTFDRERIFIYVSSGAFLGDSLEKTRLKKSQANKDSSFQNLSRRTNRPNARQTQRQSCVISSIKFTHILAHFKHKSTLITSIYIALNQLKKCN